MPVNTEHEDFKKSKNRWQICRDAIAGEDVVKQRGTAYLPRLEGQSNDDYNAYKMRAMYFNATGRTKDGIVGMIFRKDPIVSGTNDRKTLEIRVTKYGKSLLGLSRLLTGEIMSVGRVGVLLDAPNANNGRTGQASFAVYTTESIKNWETYINPVSGFEQLTMVVLEEIIKEVKVTDKFYLEEKVQYRVLELTNGVYTQTIYAIEGGVEKKGVTVTPRANGRTMDYIPFKFISISGATNGEIVKPPLYDIATVNMSHYRSSADLEHGRHFTGLPTAWVAGFPKDTILQVGSGVAWVSEDPKATAGYLEFTGQGLMALENAMKEKSKIMAILGARLLEEQQTKTSEAVDTHRLRKAGENNIVAIIAKSISGGITDILSWMQDWRVGFPKNLKIELNTDYVQTKMSSDELIALIKAWQVGLVSDETAIWNLRQGEIMPDHLEASEEIERLKQIKQEVKIVEKQVKKDKLNGQGATEQ